MKNLRINYVMCSESMDIPDQLRMIVFAYNFYPMPTSNCQDLCPATIAGMAMGLITSSLIAWEAASTNKAKNPEIFWGVNKIAEATSYFCECCRS